MGEENLLNKQYRTISIISYAAATSILIYGLVAYFFTIHNTASSNGGFENTALLRTVFLLISMGCFGMMRFIKAIFLNRQNLQGQTHDQILAKMTTMTIILLGFCETPALLGLVQSLLSRSFNEYYLFALISAVLFMINFPKYDLWQRTLAENAGVGKVV